MTSLIVKSLAGAAAAGAGSAAGAAGGSATGSAFAGVGLGVSGVVVAGAEPIPFDRIVAFYDDWTEGQPDECTRTEAGDAVSFTCATTPVRLITVTRNVPDQGEQYTMLQANAASE